MPSARLPVGRFAGLLAGALLVNSVLAGAQSTRATFKSPFGERAYVLYRPAKMHAPNALVVMLHGCTQDADDFARGTRMNEAAARSGFVVLYPEQGAANHPQKCWNWYAKDEITRDHGEVALLAALIDSVANAEKIDPAHVAVVGMSAGGAMAANLAAAYPEKVAALALHSGIAAQAATDLPGALKAMREGPAEAGLGDALITAMGAHARAIPVLAIHGADDKVVAPANLDRIVSQWMAVNKRLAPQQAVPVQRSLVAGVGHAWSGGSPDGTYTARSGMDATQLIVDFLGRVGVIAP